MNTRAKKMKPKLTAPGNDERPISWADVGTLAEVNNRLLGITAYLANAEF